MKIEIIPDSLLNGKLLHCRPIRGRSKVEAQIIPSEGESSPSFEKVIICPARQPRSQCGERMKAGLSNAYCHYWRGDSLGVYQIIGPDMDKKSNI